MADQGPQYLSDEDGELTAVVVPVSLWREINAELETRHLLRSDAMRRRLLEAKQRDGGVSLDETVQRLGISGEPVP